MAKEEKKGAGRNPFPSEPFYCVPIKLHDCGLARDLTNADFKRYGTLLRLANYYKKTAFRATLERLEELDGIAPRTAHDVHARLGEHRMVIVERNTNPYTYVVLLPSEWQSRNGVRYPASQIPQSYWWQS
jgi:hypothetical protein